MVVTLTLGQQYNVGEKPTVILYYLCSLTLCFLFNISNYRGDGFSLTYHTDSVRTSEIDFFRIYLDIRTIFLEYFDLP